MEDLFRLEETSPPPLAQLRSNFDAAAAKLAEASEIEDITGEPAPLELKRSFERARQDLIREEARLSRIGTKTS